MFASIPWCRKIWRGNCTACDRCLWDNAGAFLVFLVGRTAASSRRHSCQNLRNLIVLHAGCVLDSLLVFRGYALSTTHTSYRRSYRPHDLRHALGKLDLRPMHIVLVLAPQLPSGGRRSRLPLLVRHAHSHGACGLVAWRCSPCCAVLPVGGAHTALCRRRPFLAAQHCLAASRRTFFARIAPLRFLAHLGRV